MRIRLHVLEPGFHQGYDRDIIVTSHQKRALPQPVIFWVTKLPITVHLIIDALGYVEAARHNLMCFLVDALAPGMSKTNERRRRSIKVALEDFNRRHF